MSREAETVILFWCGVALLISGPVSVGLILAYIAYAVWARYIQYVMRIYQEKPLFVVPRGQPAEGAEAVRFPSSDGRMLNGCYFKAGGKRRGVVLFGLEFGSNCWAAHSYCQLLLENGYDVFAFEPRSQGESEAEPGYEPLQWVTEYEADDTRAAIAYLKERPDADPFGIGFFGVSKGAGAGLVAGADDPHVLCFVTDGAFGSQTTVIPFMKKWFSLYTNFPQELVEDWVYQLLCWYVVWRTGTMRNCRFASVEAAMPQLAPRALLMIHGEADSYIKPEMARSLFARAGEPKELWLVESAKHNQALSVAGDEYRRRVLRFFDTYLAARPALAPGMEKPSLTPTQVSA